MKRATYKFGLLAFLISLITFCVPSTNAFGESFWTREPFSATTIARFQHGLCSLTMLANDIAVTAHHCVNRSGYVTVDRSRPLRYDVIKTFDGVDFDLRKRDGAVIIKLSYSRSLKYRNKAVIAKKATGQLFVRCYPYSRKAGEQIFYRKAVSFYNRYRIDRGFILETLVPVSGGCSGGALYNSDGELVGVTIWSVRYINSKSSIFYDVTQHRRAIEGLL